MTGRIIGVYNLRNESKVHLIEFESDIAPSELNLGEFTQFQKDVHPMEWQAPWDEKYLNEEGTQVIGDWLNIPSYTGQKTRIAFFFHFLDFNIPLRTPVGEFQLDASSELPDRLESLINYESPN